MGKLEAEIQKLETRQKELTADLETPEVYQQPGQAMSLNREWSENSAALEQLTRQWEQAATDIHPQPPIREGWESKPA